MKKGFLIFLFLLTACLCGGCTLINVEEGERKEVEYTVLNAEAIPVEAAEIIKAQGDAEFQMTYRSGGYLYILRGYGKQKSGGYSIQVEEVTATDGAIHVKTRLLGPETKEEQKGEGSVPSLVIKTEDLELPVVFE